MSAKLSVEEILAHLEKQMAFHKQKEEHHAGAHREARYTKA